MTPQSRRYIQIFLAAAIVIAAARVGIIFYNRSHVVGPGAKTETPAPPLNPDYYVVPHKTYAYDLKSARQIVGRPTWVKEGYRYYYYSYDPHTHRVDQKHEAGMLGPIEQLQITDVVKAPSPYPGQQQVMAVFQKGGDSYAFPIGAVNGSDDYQMYVDEILYIDDPHKLYSHWPADVWDAISKHEVRPGMNEIQADFAIGMGTPESSDDPDVKVVKYLNGGHPVVVTYRNGKAAKISHA
jgi:hypothetical protein